MGKTIWLAAVVAVSTLMTAACKEGDSWDVADVRNSIQDTESRGISDGEFSGEWSIDQQVVDTARLVVSGHKLKVRLPESKLTELCFRTNYESSLSGTDKSPLVDVVNLGLPAEISIAEKGYTEKAFYNDIQNTAVNVASATYCTGGAFGNTVNGVRYVVELLTDEPGTAVFKLDTMGWTIAYHVRGFLITDAATMVWSTVIAERPFNLYYNTKERIIDR